MTQKEALQLFDERKVRFTWDSDREEWFFSVVDVVAVLTDSDRPRKYWADLKAKLKQEGNETSENIGQLKMRADDGKKRLTDVATVEQMFRIIQSTTSQSSVYCN